MTSLNYFLDKIEQLAESIQALEFDSPRIFTNAIIKKPSIIQLLKDANYNEQLLFKIKNKDPGYKGEVSDKMKESQVNLESERVDGKCYYIEPTNEDEVGLANEAIDNDDRPVVTIPKLSKGIKRKQDPDLSSSPTKVSKKIEAINDINEIYRMLVNTMNKIPNIEDDEGFMTQIEQLKLQHDGLLEEIEKLEHISEEQKNSLRNSNIDYQSSEADLDQESHDQEVDIDELIEQEEKELEELERQLRGT